VKLRGLSQDRLRLLATHDTDPFVRWESGQQFAASVLLDAAARWRAGGTPMVQPALVEMMAATIGGGGDDPAFTAEALTLPGESFLADQMAVADPEAIHEVREQTRAEIGRALASEFRSRYDELAEPGAYAIDGAAMGRRALRNVCLAYLTASGGPAPAKAQFDDGGNMTDVLAALVALSGIDCPERTQALAAFYAKWRHDDLVLDKWFAIQATSPLPDTLREVEALQSHADFDLRNPNRVRALVSSFVGGNPVRFHDATGSGYRFLADAIIRLDPLNGQVAARLVSPLGQWRRFAPANQAIMKQELQRIADTAGLTKGTYEMASKSLA